MQTSQIRHFKVSIYKTLTAEHFKSFWWHRVFALVKYSDFDLKRSSLVGNWFHNWRQTKKKKVKYTITILLNFHLIQQLNYRSVSFCTKEKMIWAGEWKDQRVRVSAGDQKQICSFYCLLTAIIQYFRVLLIMWTAGIGASSSLVQSCEVLQLWKRGVQTLMNTVSFKMQILSNFRMLVRWYFKFMTFILTEWIFLSTKWVHYTECDVLLR